MSTSAQSRPADAPRIAIIGVRKLRQGLGEHFARWLVAAGAQVPAFVARTPESAEAGRIVLARHGIDARGFTSLEALLAAEPVDAIVIASPAESHADFLMQALAAGLHVLCEKPLVWGLEDVAEAAVEIEDRFEAEGLILAEHCQWPETLGAFEALHPGVLDEALETFEMELAPSSLGGEMLVDALSHPVSLLQAILERHASWMGWGDAPRLEGARFSTRSDDARQIEAELDLRDAMDEAISVRIRLTHTPGQPRPAAYAVNGRRADRIVDPGDYSMRLADLSDPAAPRFVPLADPMQAAVAKFVEAVRRGSDPEREPGSIGERMRAVAEIVSAFRAET
jgi:predicted dehydrogenase